VHRRPLSRADLYGYLDACGPVAADVTLLSVADRLATRGARASESIEGHLELAREVIGEALRWHAEGHPRPPLRGRRAGRSARPRTRSARRRAARGPVTQASFTGEVQRPRTRSPTPAADRVGWVGASDDCIFCKILAGELPGDVVAENELAFAFADINPATRGHTLVIPRTTRRHPRHLAAADLTACALLAKDVAGRARAPRRRRRQHPPLRRRAAWQVVFHFHIHVIPRYPGDPLRLPWTPGDQRGDRRGGRELRG
jgi:histidine triad (HIT) family protein